MESALEDMHALTEKMVAHLAQMQMAAATGDMRRALEACSVALLNLASEAASADQQSTKKGSSSKPGDLLLHMISS